MTTSSSGGSQANALHAFLSRRKFDPTVFNPVDRDEPTRAALQAHIDALGQRLLPLVGQPLDKPQVLAEFRRTMGDMDTRESEDREQAAGYMEELMDIFGIESSDGLLNGWVYGLHPADIPRSHDPH